MSAFTLPLKKVIELTGGTLEIVNGISRMTGGNIGLNDYVISPAEYKDTLNGKIIDHYLNREIGTETVDMFQLAMRRRMNEIMPYFNKLYESTALEFDPLSTVDMITVSNGTATSTATSENSNSSRAVNSETPQMMLAGNGDYASSAADVNGTASAENTGSNESETTSTMKGYQGSAADLLMRYRETIVNIDMQIIAALEPCFMQVWDTDDSYTTSPLYPLYPRGIYF